jgi:hypothetical protein
MEDLVLNRIGYAVPRFCNSMMKYPIFTIDTLGSENEKIRHYIKNRDYSLQGHYKMCVGKCEYK